MASGKQVRKDEFYTPVVEKHPAAVGVAKKITSGKKISAAETKIRYEQREAPTSLLNLCVACLGSHLHDIVDEMRSIATIFPPSVKAALLAIGRRRNLLNDKLLVALGDEAWEILDVSGSDVSDAGIETVARLCPFLKAVDISRCSKLSSMSIYTLIENCPALETLRCGGSKMSDRAARCSLEHLLPRLNVDEEIENWEDLETKKVGRGAQSLRWLVWPSIDATSQKWLEMEGTRIMLNPKPTKFYHKPQVPQEALPGVVLDEPLVKGIDPATWAVRSSFSGSGGGGGGSGDGSGEMSIAERFKLAFDERDERLAPKRAKNLRQNQRRAKKVWLSSNVEAKACHLACRMMNIG